MIVDLSKLATAIANEVVQKLQGYEPKSTDELLTIDEAGQYLRLKTATLYKMASKGEIPALKINNGRLRFQKSQLEAWLQNQTK